MNGQVAIWCVLATTLGLFVWGRWRYDLVAMMSLLVSILLGLVSPNEAFAGFGEPAVVTVALVLVVGKGLVNSGLVHAVSLPLGKIQHRPLLQMAAFTLLITVVSGFMNNIGALAIIMPVAVSSCRQGKTSPSLLLMPLAFGSLLGGMTTMIGTPPNIILSNQRQLITGEPFSLFDFAPVGVGVALAGVFFIIFVGWRLIPHRVGHVSAEEMFEVKAYLTEVVLPKASKMVGRTLGELEEATGGDATVLGVIRAGKRLPSAARYQQLKEDDVLIVEADTEALEDLLLATGAELGKTEGVAQASVSDDEEMMMEVVLAQPSRAIGNSPSSLRFRSRFDVSIVAVARQGHRVKERLSAMRLRQGDVLLLKGSSIDLAEAVRSLGGLPLAPRGIRLEPARFLEGGLPLAAALIASTLGLLPIHVGFLFVAITMILTKLVSLREAYESIDWAILVLLGALIPLGQAFDSTGAAESVAEAVLSLGRSGSPTLMLAVLLIGTMFLSDIINNAAAAILMGPIAVRVAAGLGASLDPFLMAVAIGASCAFLTPIGHQSNTMVMGPGGYRFGDYWRMGLPLEAIIVAVSLPLLQFFWPL